MQLDITGKQLICRNQSSSYKNNNLYILMKLFEKKYIGPYFVSESIVEAKAIREELLKVKAISRVEYNKCPTNFFYKWEQNLLII